jgi:hypothetical protein
MERAAYDAFTAGLVDSLSERDGVVGLVAAGSAAGTPDRYSDHDLLVVAESSVAGGLRTDPSWLPDSERIVLAFPENELGTKVMYDEGHLVEYTVLTLGTLDALPLNRVRVLLDRSPGGDLAERIDAVVAATPGRIAANASSDNHHEGQLLTALLVGVQRHRRGEEMSAVHFVHYIALRHFLVLLGRHRPSESPGAVDDLNPFRRVERAWPSVGGELGRLLRSGDVELVAGGLLDLAARELAGPLDTSRPAWESVRGYLDLRR